MGLADGKHRIAVTVSDGMLEKLDFYSEQMGLSRSALGAYLIGQGVMGIDAAARAVEGISTKVAADISRANN